MHVDAYAEVGVATRAIPLVSLMRRRGFIPFPLSRLPPLFQVGQVSEIFTSGSAAPSVKRCGSDATESAIPAGEALARGN